MGTDKLTTTKWHWMMLILTPLSIFMEAILTHSFGTFIGYFAKKDTILLLKLNTMTTLASAIPQLSLPFLVMGFQRVKKAYQLYAAVGFILMAISVFATSAVKLESIFLLYVTYSLLYGVGCALVVAVSMIQISEYFPTDHPCYGVATTLFQIGYPVSAGVCNPLAAYLIELFGWKVTLQIFGGIFLIVGAFISVFFKPINQSKICQWPPPDGDASQRKTSDTQTIITSDGEGSSIKLSVRDRIWTTPQIFFWLLAKFVNYTCWFATRTNLVAYFKSRSNFGLQKSALLMTAYATAEIITALLCIGLARLLARKLLLVHIFASAGLTTVCLLWTTVVNNYASSVVGVIFIGAFIQLTISFGYSGSVEVTGWDMNTAWSTTLLAAGLGILASTSIGGFSAFLYGNLDVIFWTIGGASAISCLLYISTFLVIYFWTSHKTPKEDYAEMD